MDVAVLGGGPGAYAAAADLTRAGHRVRLWRRAAAELERVAQAGGLAIAGAPAPARARPAQLTADLGEAVRGAEVVLVAVPAPAHEDLAKRLAPHLEDHQVVLLAPGTLGALVVARELARAGGRRPLALAEAATLPYVARRTGPAEVVVAARALRLPTGVFPATRAAAVLERLRQLYPAVVPAADVLDAALLNPGPVVHPALLLLEAAALDRGADTPPAALTPTARRLVDAVDAERVAARRGLGYGAPHYEAATLLDAARAADGLYDAAGAYLAHGAGSAALSLEHRWVTEDAALGLALLESAARTAGVESPATTGLLLVFGALLGRPLGGRGRALEALGLGDFLLREIRALLAEGWDSPLWTRALR